MDYLNQNLTLEEFIKLMNLSKIYIPCIKEALKEEDISMPSISI